MVRKEQYRKGLYNQTALADKVELQKNKSLKNVQIDQQLIKKAQRNDRLAQKQLYDQYAPALLSVCRLYISDLQFAEDTLLKAFFKIFLRNVLNHPKSCNQ